MSENKALNVLLQLGKAICYILLYFGMQMIIDMGLIIIYIVMAAVKSGGQAGAYDPMTIVDEAMNYILGIQPWVIIASTIITMLILWGFFAIRKKKLPAEARMQTMKPQLLLPLILAGVGFALAIEVGMELLPIPEALMEAYGEQAGMLVVDSVLLMFVAEVIAAPVIEEIIFRGLVLSRLRRAMPTWVAVLVSSLAFGLVHGQPIWMAYTFLFGILLSVVAVKADSIYASMVVHMTFNLLGALVLPAVLPEEVPATSVLLVLLVVGIAVLAAGMVLLQKMTKKDLTNDVQ